MLAVTIAVALPKTETPAGTVDTEAFGENSNVKYPLSVSEEFTGYITEFQTHLIDGILLYFGFEPEGWTISGALLAGMIKDFYSAAGIPAEKLLNLGKLLASYSDYDIYSAGFDVIKFFVEITPITEEQTAETYIECSNCGELQESEYTLTPSADGEDDVYSCNKCSGEGVEATVAEKHRYMSWYEWYCPTCDDYLGKPDMTEVTGSDPVSYICNECGTTVEKRLVSVSYASINTLAARMAAADPWSVWKTFAEKTMLSTEETARLIYQAIYTLRDEADRKIMDSFGKTRFVNLLVSAVTIAEGLSGFGNGSGSLIEARALAALAYEAGTALDNAVSETGTATFLEAFGLKGYSAEVDITEILEDKGVGADDLAAMKDFNEVMQTADTVSVFLTETLIGALLSSDTPMFDAVYYASAASDAAERQKYRDFYVLQTAKCLTAGLERAFNSGCGISDAEDAAEKLAVVFEKLSGLDDENAVNVSAEELKRLFGEAAEISELTAANANDILSLSDADRKKIAGFGDFAGELTESGKLSGGLDIFASTFVANLIYDTVSAAAEDVTINK